MVKQFYLTHKGNRSVDKCLKCTVSPDEGQDS